MKSAKVKNRPQKSYQENVGFVVWLIQQVKDDVKNMLLSSISVRYLGQI